MTERRKPRSYTDEFKQQLVQLYDNGKRKCDIFREYDIATSLLDKCNEFDVQNIVNRKFSDQPQYKVVVSDLTYVRVGNSWNYICVLVDLFNREIIGYSAGKNKDAALVRKAFSRVDVNLNKIQIFHTGHGNEFKNRILDETLKNTYKSYPGIRGCILHSDRGTQYTSERYRNTISKYGIVQSMNSAGVKCHDNARCESSIPIYLKSTRLPMSVWKGSCHRW